MKEFNSIRGEEIAHLTIQLHKDVWLVARTWAVAHNRTPYQTPV